MEFDIAVIRIEVPVRYGEEQIPNDFPLRRGDMWRAVVDVDTGKIKDWPQGRHGLLRLKVVDQGTYTLFDPTGNQIAEIAQDYVPNEAIPGEYGDYIKLDILGDGVIANWFSEPSFEEFFKNEE